MDAKMLGFLAVGAILAYIAVRFFRKKKKGSGVNVKPPGPPQKPK